MSRRVPRRRISWHPSTFRFWRGGRLHGASELMLLGYTVGTTGVCLSTRAGEVMAASERCCGNKWPMNGNTSVCCARSGPVRPTGNATRCCEDRRGRYRALYDHTKQVSFVTCHSPPTRLRSRFLPSPPPLPFPPVLPSLPSLRSRPLKSS